MLTNRHLTVPEWWYAIFNVIAVALGCAAVAGWPTYTNVGVVFFGLALAIVFVIPTGIIKATTGIEVEFKLVQFTYPSFPIYHHLPTSVDYTTCPRKTLLHLPLLSYYERMLTGTFPCL